MPPTFLLSWLHHWLRDHVKSSEFSTRKNLLFRVEPLPLPYTKYFHFRESSEAFNRESQNQIKISTRICRFEHSTLPVYNETFSCREYSKLQTWSLMIWTLCSQLVQATLHKPLPDPVSGPLCIYSWIGIPISESRSKQQLLFVKLDSLYNVVQGAVSSHE